MRERVLEAIQRKVDGQEITAEKAPDSGGQDSGPHGRAQGEPRVGAAGGEDREEAAESIVKLLAGTSGYAFKEWKGSFYPEDLKDDGMLGLLRGQVSDGRDQQHLLPSAQGARAHGVGIAGARRHSPSRSRRASGSRIMRGSRPECAEPLEFLLKTTTALGRAARTDPVSASAESQEGFRPAAGIPRDAAGRPEVHDRVPEQHVVRRRDLRRACGRATLRSCLSEQPEFSTPVVSTASWGYARLHRLDYSEAQLAEWARQIAAQPWSEAYVYLKHDEGMGSGPPAVSTFTREFDRPTPH